MPLYFLNDAKQQSFLHKGATATGRAGSSIAATTQMEQDALAAVCHHSLLSSHSDGVQGEVDELAANTRIVAQMTMDKHKLKDEVCIWDVTITCSYPLRAKTRWLRSARGRCLSDACRALIVKA